MPVNEEYVEAKIREVNDAIKMLKETASKNYSELTEHEMSAKNPR
jgi:hypothetical protein